MKFNKILLLALLSLPFFGQAQQVKKWEAGVFVGISGYLGDLNKSDFFSREPRAGLGLLGRYHISPNFALRGSLNFGRLSGKDSYFDDRKVRNLTTTSPLSEIAGIIEWDPFGKKRFVYDSVNYQVKFSKRLSPYFFTGLGFAFTNPKPDFSNPLTTNPSILNGIAQDKVAVYSNLHATIPFGIGVKYDLDQKWVLGLEGSFRLAFSDYLDGISKAGNPGRDDRYVFYGFTLTRRLGPKDTDNDGIADSKDGCPTTPGSKKLNGCPDFDRDGVVDKDDDCPTIVGLSTLKGCPDMDADGVADKDDVCPNAKGLAIFGGCPDGDNDGVPDKDDACPTVAGVVALNGCPDGDGDGVADKDDACPTAAGKKELNGCPDSDGDGVADKDDDCPAAAGKKELKGCPDGDGDGIADKNDACPTLPGTAQYSGCPDSDGDGIVDPQDVCPQQAGVAQYNGCPDAPKVDQPSSAKSQINAESGIRKPNLVDIQPEQKIVNVTLRPVLFEAGRSQIPTDYYAVLDEAAAFMNANPDFKLRIIGHTDEIGDQKQNQRLSERRSEVCFDYLLKKNVLANRMSFGGVGENQPTNGNRTKEARQQNRRVNFEPYKN